MFTFRPLCQEGIDYVEEQLLLRGFDKRGKLFIRRSGPIVATVYPRWECGQMEDYVMGTQPIWACPDKIVQLRDGDGMKWGSIVGRMAVGTTPSPTPESPFHKVKKIPYTFLDYYFRGFTPEDLRREYGVNVEDLRWEHIQEVLDCTLLAPLDYRATYEGEKAHKEFLRQTRHVFVARRFYMYEKDLPNLQADVRLEQKYRDECLRQYGFYLDVHEKNYQQTLQILQAVENGDWTPAEQLLAEMSAGGLALLKRYHIEDKGPYPKEFARLRYDD